MREKKAFTIKDVAKLAGVSIATVSAVINRNRFVSNELVERVLKAIQELDYHPDRTARSLKRGRSFQVVYVVPSITNPIFADVTRGIQDIMEKVHYDVLIYNTDFSDKKLFHHLTNVLEHKPAGIILSAWHSPEIKRAILLVQELEIPLVVVHAPRDVENVDAILVDDESGAYEAVSYLLELGHKHIISLGVQNSTTSNLREFGYRRALQKANLPVQEALILKGEEFSTESASETMRKALNTSLEFTAIFAHSDLLAIGAVEALHEAGLRVPEKVSVMGFDGAYAFCSFPKLTTMCIPNYEMGKKAAEILLKKINGDKEKNTKETVKPSLVVQGSVQDLYKP